MKIRNQRWKWLVPVVAVAVIVIGCQPSSKEEGKEGLPETVGASGPAEEPNDGEVITAAANAEAGHGHKPGAHGGMIVPLGRDSYHVEAVIDSAGVVRLYTLGQDESRVIDVERQTLKGFIKGAGDVDSEAIEFEPSPQDGDAEGKTSLFLGQLPQKYIGREIDVTIPNIRVAGERFRLGFVSGESAHEESAMPAKVVTEEERELYLTAGGRYTAADIEANGGVTPLQKFKGIKSTHDMKPKSGDRICPITETKANPLFSWVIDGKSYQFCCPPCVDEFLKAAKASDAPLAPPESYVKP
jgi:YHS domain-containing protein